MIHRRSRRATVLQYAALFGFIVFLSFPLLWMLSTSFKGPRELSSSSRWWCSRTRSTSRSH